MKHVLRDVLHAAAALLATAGAIALLNVAWEWRSPMSPELRYPVLAGLLLATGALGVPGWMVARRAKAWRRGAGGLVLALCVSAATLLLSYEGHFQWMRYRVQTADPWVLRTMGHHIVLGYTDAAEIRGLIGKGAVGGVFVTARNVRGKSKEEIAAEIHELKARRRALGSDIPELWVAADQEGGVVSRMSPPLTALPPLARVVASFPDPGQRHRAVEAYGRVHATELKAIGVNLNLAPVVDVSHGIVNRADKYTRIYRRSIAPGPREIAEVGRIYCNQLALAGVRCTVKHFPGLGGVINDTHLGSAELNARPDELERTDWIPFRELASDGTVAMMLSHARLTALDPVNPVSSSERVVAGLLRGQWKFDGVLVTDDFSMEALYGSEGGIGGAAVNSLNAGVDLLLVSFDHEQVYPVLYALMEVQREGRLDLRRVEQSRARLLRQQEGAAVTR